MKAIFLFLAIALTSPLSAAELRQVDETVADLVFLIVDDEEYHATVIIANLGFIANKLGKKFVILAKNNGAEAVRFFRSRKPSDRKVIVFMDQHMPQLEGTPAIAEIKDLCTKDSEEVSQLPYIIGSSGNQGQPAGADEHMAKPIHYSNLFSKVQQFLADGSFGPSLP